MIRKLFNFNSILGKLMLSHLVIILISLTVIGVMFGYLVQNYYYGLKEWEATNNSRRVASLVSENISEGNIFMTNDTEIGNTRSKINTIARSTDMDIGLIDKNGQMILNVPSIKADLSLETEELNHVLTGNTFSKKIMGPDYRYLLMVIPLIEDDNESINIMRPQQMVDSKHVVGAVLIQTPLGNIGTTINNIMRFIIYSFIVAFAAALFLSISFSKKITKPINKIKEAALKSVDGKVEKVNIPDNSSEEINHLVYTYNYAAKQINQTLEKQKALEKMQKQFVANVSHEFRAPLTSIKGFIEIIQERNLCEDDIQEYLDIMYKDTNHLEKLLNDLLVLSKLDTDKESLNFKKTSPKYLVEQALKSLKNIINNKNIKINKDIDDDIKNVKVDQSKIHQVLINLIENAVNYSKPNSIITIKVENTNEDNYNAKFSIIDNGIGIPKNELDNIWKRFYKVDRARTREKEKGSGLGLAIVKDIIEKHKGSIDVKSNVNNGTAFIFKL